MLSFSSAQSLFYDFQRIAKHDSMFFTFNGEEFILPKKKIEFDVTR